jgi:sugar lactone lactonase YvrE
VVFSTLAAAETLYVATLRSQPGVDGSIAGGALYAFDLAKGVSSLVAPIRIGGALPIGITGLAVHPKTGVFYGLTAGLAPNLPRSLVTIDPTNGNATLIGSLGQAGSDIRFDPNGTLYVWLVDLNRLGTVDLGTGVVKALDNPVYQQTLGGGIAIDRDGLVYISANSSAGSLDVFDPATHKLTTGPTMTGAPYISSMNSMAFSENGTLYAVNSNLGTPAKTRLVSIDAKTGVVKEIAVLPDDVDPLAFASGTQERKSADGFARWERWIYLALAFAFGLAAGLLIARRRRAPVARRE